MSEIKINRSSWLMIAALGVIWGATFPVIELALQGITPFWLASARIGLATVLTLGVWRFRGTRLFERPLNKSELLNLLIVGALSSALPFMLISWGQQYVTAGFTGISMASAALMVLPLAHFLIAGEQLSWRKTLGFVVGFVGIVILIGGNAFETTGTRLETPGRFAVLGAAGCYAISSVFMRRLPAVDPIGLSGVLLVIGAMIVVPAAVLVEGVPPVPDGKTLFWLAVLGLIPTAGANLLRVQLIRTAGPTFMSLTNYMVPLWAVFMGWLFLSEDLPGSLIWALLLILGGVGLSQYGSLKRLFGR